MKLLAIVHAAVPVHNAGAEAMLHTIFRYMVQHGHECRILATDIPEGYSNVVDGVEIRKYNHKTAAEYVKWSNVMFTHLVQTGKAYNWAKEYGKRLIVFVHNTFLDRMIEVKQDVEIIYNAEWTKEFLQKEKGHKHRNMVLHPPVKFEDYNNKKNSKKYITLINCWEFKGGKMLIELARRMPDYQFAGVMGAYGYQEKGKLPNLKYFDHTDDINKIYRQTRLLIMPSHYESYGRTAVEAMCSGIPVVATDTPGLRESLGDCGTFCQWHDYDGWVAAIKSFDQKEKYKDFAERGIERAKYLSEKSEVELAQFEHYVCDEPHRYIDYLNRGLSYKHMIFK